MVGADITELARAEETLRDFREGEDVVRGELS